MSLQSGTASEERGLGAAKDATGMRLKRVIAAILAVLAAPVAFWAALEPRSFYDSFPGGGRHWVSILGPYDEHLVRDVGSLYLTLFVITGWAALRPRLETFALVGTGWVVFGVPHLIFHLNHLHGMSVADQIGNVVDLGGTVVLALVMAIPFRAQSVAAQ